MKLTNWQLKLVRDALRAYKTYGRDELSGKDYSWASVSEGIAEYTGVSVPSERLRQFVEGVTIKSGSRKYPVPTDERLTAIVQFVTHDELELLTQTELEAPQPAFQVPLKLLAYLDQEQTEERLIPTATMKGWYRALRADNENFIVREITLDQPSDKGLVEVSETEDRYDAGVASEFGDNGLMPDAELKLRKSRTQHAGWAILTPEDNFLVFLKNVRNGRNRYYFSLATDHTLWTDEPMQRIVLLGHEYPLELEEQDSDISAIARKTVETAMQHIAVFSRFNIRPY